VQRLLIIGSGDVARRALPRLVRRYRVYALLRDRAKAAEWRAAGATPVLADLDDRRSLARLAGLADLVLHCAPPANAGTVDGRTRRLLAALGKAKSLPRRLVYVSTTGVYGDCSGACIDETRAVAPGSARAGRRVDAEARLRAWGRDNGATVCLVRAPGIYAAERLPLERLRAGTPALVPADDVYTNHIHAEDLAAACLAALGRGRPNRAYNAVDDTDLTMGAYFDRVADAFALPRPPRIRRAEASGRLTPLQLSFMAESRRIGNRRLKEELGVVLACPTVEAGIAAAIQQQRY